MPRAGFPVSLNFSLWATCTWFMLHRFGILPHSKFLLVSGITISWIILKAVLVASKTLYRRNHTPLKQLPGPKSNNWLYDHMFDFFDDQLGARVTTWINERPYPQGLMHAFGLFGKSYIFPTDPQTLSEVLSLRAYDYVKPTGFKRYTLRFWGHGIVSQEQEEHKQNRRPYLTIYNQRNVDRLDDVLTAKAMQFVDHVTDLCNQTQGDDSAPSVVVNIQEPLAKVCLDVTGISSLGVDFETILGKHQEVYEAHEMLFTATEDKRLLFILYNIAPQWLLDVLPPLAVAKKLDGARDVLANACRRVIRERSNQMEKDKIPALDFLTNAMNMEPFNEVGTIAHIVVILGAGYESIGGTMAWAMYCLAKHPEIQEKLRQELAAAKKGRESIDEKDYETLPLLHAVVMEVTRLYPPFSFLLRKAMRDTTINGQFIPRNTYVGLCPHAINYAEHLWGPDADQFRPSRWFSKSDPTKLDPAGGSPSPICMFSFFYGARNCVGKALSLALMKRQVAVVVARYHLHRVDESYDPSPTGLFATGAPHDLQIKFTEVSG